MPEPTITKPEEHFFVTTYEGNGGGQRVGNFVPFTDQATLTKSVKIDAGSDEGLYRDFSSPSNNKKWTFSGWFKLANLGTNRTIISAGLDGGEYADVRFDTNNIIYFQNRVGATNLVLSSTTRTYEDTSKWYHIVLIYDSDQGSASNRWKVYVDGDLQAVDNYPGSGDASAFNKASVRHRLSVSGTTQSSEFTPAFEGDFAGIAQQMFFDGQAYTPDNFGITDTSTGRWIPKTLGSLTYGNNGFRLDFANTAGQTIGDDTSGNTNDFSLYNLTTADLTTDSPTQNHAIIDIGLSGSLTYTEGNLKVTGVSNNWETAFATLPVDSGKWYFEITVTTMPAFFIIGVSTLDGLANHKSTYVGDYAGAYSMQIYPGVNDYTYIDGTSNDEGVQTSLSSGNILQVAYDGDTGKYFLGVNDTWAHSGNPSTGVNPIFAGHTAGKKIYFGLSPYNGGVFDFNFGQKSFSYTPPTGFKSLQQDNFPETGKGIPDLSWIKNRDQGDGHQVYDSSRGAILAQRTDTNVADTTTNDGLQKFLKGGFAIEDDVSINTIGESYVAWNWVANGGTTSANTDGSGATIASTVQANQTAGFSIVTYTGNATAGAKVAHGLSQAPDWIWLTSRSLTSGPKVYHHKNTAAPETDYLSLNFNNATFDSLWLNDTAPDSNCFTVGPTGYSTNNLNATYVAYCWHEIEGFSKFGSYKGNGSADGTFVYTGFKPAWLMTKKSNSTGNWCICLLYTSDAADE